MVDRQEIILGTGPIEASLAWVPDRVAKFMGELAMLHDDETVLVPPQPIVRTDGKTLFACSGVQIIYPQLFDGAPVPDRSQLISQPVIRTQHLPRIKEGTSTSFVNYNLIRFGLSEGRHQAATAAFFDSMRAVDNRGRNDNRVVLLEDAPQVWNGLPVKMSTNEKLWINGVELGESIFYGDMPLASGERVSVSELAFGLERLFFATGDPAASYFSSELGGIDTDPSLKDEATASVAEVIKSTTLMAIAGVEPSNNNQGSKMRKFIKTAVAQEPSIKLGIPQIINNAYRYWSNFITPEPGLDTVSGVVMREWERNQNRRTLDRLARVHGIRVSMEINQPRAAFADQLLRTGRVGREVATMLFDRNPTAGLSR